MARARLANEQAQAAIKELELADLQTRMAHPLRPGARTDAYRRIQASAREKIANAGRAEWESALAQQRAMGQLNPEQVKRLEVMGRQLQQADLRIEILRQNVQAGTFKPAQAVALLERYATQVRVLEHQATRGAAGAGIAAEEAAVKLTTMKERLKLIQEAVRQQGLLPEPTVTGFGQTHTPLPPP